jgi:hypothetical protein
MEDKIMLRPLGVATLIALFAGTANAATIHYTTVLNGAAEIPPNASPGVGSVFIIVDTTLATMRIMAEFSGLIGNTTAAHIHCCTLVPGGANVGVATQTPSFTGFPLGVQAGTMDTTFDMTLASSYNAAFITAQGGIPNAFMALLAGMGTGNAYFNVHTTTFPGGEIRGLLRPVPEPATLLLLASGVAGVRLRQWRKRRAGGSDAR